MINFDKYCCQQDLRTYDPYDVWKTHLGFCVKDIYNTNMQLGFLPAAMLTVFDMFNHRRYFYQKQEYPIVRAWAVLILLNLYKKKPNLKYFEFAKLHLAWLAENHSTGYKGIGWGLNFPYAVSKGLHYDADTPFSTMTPYCLEAFVAYQEVTGDTCFDWILQDIFIFFDQDIRVMCEDEISMATSYTPIKDRIVINALSYTMYALSILLKKLFNGSNQAVEQKVKKLFNFIIMNQHDDGSWYYSPDGESFIDCFHSCITIKNIIKTNQFISLNNAADCISRGYQFLRKKLFDEKKRLFRRFASANKPGIIKYDLYDNAEMLNLCYLCDDKEFAENLLESIKLSFCQHDQIYSQIDVFGRRINPAMLRLAVMPYLYSLSLFA